MNFHGAPLMPIAVFLREYTLTPEATKLPFSNGRPRWFRLQILRNENYLLRLGATKEDMSTMLADSIEADLL